MKNIVTILGSGFGLYGYLPALVDVGVEKIILPLRYQEKFTLRSELLHCSNNITWVKDEEEAIQKSDTLIIALRPDLQVQWVSKCLNQINIKRIILEKPLAQTPEKSQLLLEDIIKKRKIIRIGYIFRYTSWGKELIQSLSKIDIKNSKLKIRISWIFMANHFKYNTKNWKRYNSEGGGAIRFYGIHLIALLAELGYTEVLSSKGFGLDSEEITIWAATFSGKLLPDCEVLVNTRSEESKFSIEKIKDYEIKSNVSQADPFSDMENSLTCSSQDIRVTYIVQLYHSLLNDSENNNEWYKKTINLWRMTESYLLLKKC